MHLKTCSAQCGKLIKRQDLGLLCIFTHFRLQINTSGDDGRSHRFRSQPQQTTNPQIARPLSGTVHGNPDHDKGPDPRTLRKYQYPSPSSQILTTLHSLQPILCLEVRTVHGNAPDLGILPTHSINVTHLIQQLDALRVTPQM